jgi:hypothetical protein
MSLHPQNDHIVGADQMIEIRKGARRLPNGDRTQLARRSFKRRLGHRVLIPAPSPESRLEPSHRAEPNSPTRNHPLIPAAGQRGRSPEHAVAQLR